MDICCPVFSVPLIGGLHGCLTVLRSTRNLTFDPRFSVIEDNSRINGTIIETIVSYEKNIKSTYRCTTKYQNTLEKNESALPYDHQEQM